jgi:hypothetical protein
MVIDPRYIDMFGWGRKFRCSVNGRILTIARIDDDTGWDRVVYLHAYLPTETIPDFTSTVYTYWGLEDEFVPQDATKVIFHPSVTTIRGSAFDRCRSLVRVTIPDTVTSIEGYAFAKCFSLRFIRLSTNLEFIGEAAFKLCTSLEAVFLPPTITSIGDYVFQECTSLRFCILPVPIDHVGFDVFDYCDRLSRTVRNYLSRVCYSTSITSQVIQECIHTHGIERATEVNDEQMTALHILCSNPHVTADCIRTYLQLAPEAAEQEDSDGMTPFQYLCRNDVTVLDDRTFSSVMAFWYGCMPPLIETGTKRKRE